MMKKPSTSEAYDALTSCPCCGTRSGLVISNRDGKTSEPLITVSCNGCGMGRIDPLPSEEDLEQWYENHYRQAYKGLINPKLKYVLRAARNAKERLRWLNDHLERTSSPAEVSNFRSLDIGASSGEFVALMKTVGCEAKGIEPHKGYAEYARQQLQLEVFPGSLNQGLQSVDKHSMNLITMFHVLEHLPNPIKSLTEIGQRLKSDGCLFIEVPNATRMTSPHYMFFRAHTLYFTKQSLTHLLNTAGYDVVASNAKDSGNLRVIARYQGGAAAQHSAVVTHQHALVAAQTRRRWLPYLFKQLIEMRFVTKIQNRLDENKVASRYKSAPELLQDSYKDAVMR